METNVPDREQRRSYINSIIPLMGSDDDPFSHAVGDALAKIYKREEVTVSRVLHAVAAVALQGARLKKVDENKLLAGVQMVVEIYRDSGATLESVTEQDPNEGVLGLKKFGSVSLTSDEAVDVLYATLKGMAELNRRYAFPYN